MANITRNFTAGRMNKVVDERLIPNGEYIDALNIRMGSTEQSEIGAIENTKGNLPLTSLNYIDGTPLSVSARCIGAVEDATKETIYWFVHDPAFPVGATGKLDMIVSFNVFTNILTYNVISIDEGNGLSTTLNFNPTYLITGVNIIDDFLYFTDNYNPPRFIKTTINYPNPVLDIDQFSAESILVIKQPPIESPTIQPIATSSQDNFLETRFICFAYRYEYADGQYSATSQFSAPSFFPKSFNFSIESYLNEGMVNNTNACNITYNTGGPLVKSIDLLFKSADGNIIKVIEKLNKQELGLSDNTLYTYQFSNSKIFTVLPESELLRLYDNVPLLAQAQTIMGNRLMYGNYIEGYDLVDLNGNPTMFEYFTTLVSETIGDTTIPDGTGIGDYTINGPISVTDAYVTIDLDGLNLVAGSSINLDVNIEHAQFSGTLPYPTQTTGTIQLSFTFYLQTDYASAYDLANSIEFKDAIGTVFNIKPVYSANPLDETSCDGITFTDNVNCVIPNTLDALIKYRSGITGTNQPIFINTLPGSPIIGLLFPAMEYVNNVTTPTQSVFEYYKVNFAQATFQEIANPKSLHSNRDYEIGIVYMDEFNRSSTALVSPLNTQHIPCGYAKNKNSIRVTIPTTQKAPYWAKRYKFVIKPDEENYETIYSSIFFKDPNTYETYFLLEGENARKVEQGDRFIVKADSDGPTQSCVYATVLEKESKAENFILIPSELDPSQDIYVPSGVYMKINTNSFSAVNDELAVIAPGNLQATAQYDGTSPILNYPMNYEDLANPGSYLDYDVPAGSRIKLLIKLSRLGKGDGTGACERRIYTLEKTYVSSNNYDNMQDWWNGDNIQTTINDGITDCGGGCTINNVYIPTTATTAIDVLTALDTNYYKFYRNATTNYLGLLVTGTYKCSSWLGRAGRESRASADITVYRTETTIVFETLPQDAQPNIWYENDLSFSINASGEHMGNVTNQDIALGIPAVIDTDFFNCFSFGNGVESYKIRDSITGRTFNLGNRVTSVANQDYSEVNRFADITYSGIFNNESNVNKLNEFNLGLLNFKNLEISFGPIYLMDARKTDILVLQEDKISYVLADKNLLSDASGGGALTSIPEVLGTQIARTEKYGISFNPESYVQWGTDRYFTDTKRGAVIQLTGDDSSSGQLIVVSESGMRSWFRDLFIDSFNTQKLGGFDPYMNEYVLSSNDILVPSNPQCLDCGITQTFVLTEGDVINYCVDLGQLVGDAVVSYSIVGVDDFIITNVGDFDVITQLNDDNIVAENSGNTAIINAVYDGTTYSSGDVSGSGSFIVNKDIQNISTVDIEIISNGNVTIQLTVSCPIQQELNIVNVVITNDYQTGETIHAQYRYTNGTFISPLQSNLVSFISGNANPLVSYYNILTGYVGSGGFPPAGSTMTISTNKYASDTFDFEPLSDKFMYYRSNILYANTPVDIQALLAVASTASPNLGGGAYNYADFTVPTVGQYLYLIWNFRDSISVPLCYDENNNVNALCCNCEPPELPCRTFNPEGLETPSAEIQWIDCNGDSQNVTITTATPLPYNNLCVLKPYFPFVVSGNIGFDLLGDCDVPVELCSTWAFSELETPSAEVQWIDCNGVTQNLIITTATPLPYNVCILQPNSPVLISGVIGWDPTYVVCT
jgi:hypothetical protein